MLRVLCAAAIAAAIVPAPPASTQIAMLPSANGQSAAYDIAFNAEYGGYVERYHGTLALTRVDERTVRAGGQNDRVAGLEGHLSSTSAHTADLLAPRTPLDGTIAVPQSVDAIADQVFDFDSIVTLFSSRPAGATHWTATSKTWASNTVTADLPVTVELTGDQPHQHLIARGSKRIEVGTAATPIAAQLNISIDARLDNGILTDSTMTARESYTRNRLPAGGGTYSWTLHLKGTNS